MERLTKKEKYGPCFGYNINVDKPKENDTQSGYYVKSCIGKLGKLEDIEEELGIDLVTVIKASRYGIYGKVGDKIEHILSPYLSLNLEEIYIFKIKDYGKTWALTKEELQ